MRFTLQPCTGGTTAGSNPLGWAVTTVNLAVSLKILGELVGNLNAEGEQTTGISHILRAVQLCRTALTEPALPDRTKVVALHETACRSASVSLRSLGQQSFGLEALGYVLNHQVEIFIQDQRWLSADFIVGLGENIIEIIKKTLLLLFRVTS